MESACVVTEKLRVFNILFESYFQIDKNDPREHIEISLESGAIIERMSQRIAEKGGFALITDYGHQGDKTDTFRVIIKKII